MVIYILMWLPILNIIIDLAQKAYHYNKKVVSHIIIVIIIDACRKY